MNQHSDKTSRTSEFRPTATWDILVRRAELLSQLRSFFDQHGFLEVETPLISTDTIVDRHLDPIEICSEDGFRSPTDSRPRLWLQTSPESAMKRLLASGATAIYQVCKAFRLRERGNLHNPEFTLVEWYRRDDRMDDGIEFLSTLADTLLNRGPAEKLSYQAAFLKYANVDPLKTNVEQLQAQCTKLGISIPAQLDCELDDWLELLLTEVVQPRLGQQTPVILYNFPASQAALANVCELDRRVARRFELFIDGMELANGYEELRDADELERRMEMANRQRIADQKQSLPGAEKLLAAMQDNLPPCTGVALGWDRIVMLATGCTRIDQVVSFPWERA